MIITPFSGTRSDNAKVQQVLAVAFVDRSHGQACEKAHAGRAVANTCMIEGAPSPVAPGYTFAARRLVPVPPSAGLLPRSSGSVHISLH